MARLKAWKTLNGLQSFLGAEYSWAIGEWFEVPGRLKLRENGIYLFREHDLLYWLHKDIYEAEFAGKYIESTNAILVNKARITKRLDLWDEDAANIFMRKCIDVDFPRKSHARSNDLRRYIREYIYHGTGKAKPIFDDMPFWDKAKIVALLISGLLSSALASINIPTFNSHWENDINRYKKIIEFNQSFMLMQILYADRKCQEIVTAVNVSNGPCNIY